MSGQERECRCRKAWGERGGRGKGRDVSRNTATADYDIMAARGNQLWFIGLPVARCLVHLC